MNYCTALLVTIVFAMIGCKPKSSSEETTQRLDSPLINTEDSWKLISPETKSGCELLVSFGYSQKMQMNFRGEVFEGYYEIDSVLTNYVRIDIFNKRGWDDECSVNPEYLTLYDSDTEFSYTIIDNKLYFQKAEKAIVFERVADQKI